MAKDFNVRLEAETFDHKTQVEDIITVQIAGDAEHLAIFFDGVEIVFNLKDWVKFVTSKMLGVDLENLVDFDDPDIRAQLKALIEKKRTVAPITT